MLVTLVIVSAVTLVNFIELVRQSREINKLHRAIAWYLRPMDVSPAVRRPR